MTLHKDTERVPFCCDYHDRYGDHCLFQYQAARPPKASDAARQILNEAIAAGAAVPSWNTKQRQQSEAKILAAIDTALTTARKEARAAAFREVADIERDFRAMTRPDFYVKYKVTTLAQAIEAAANTEEGGGNE